MRTSLHHLLEQKARSTGSAPALTYKDVTYSYMDLWRAVQAFASGLERIGLKRGERVATFIESRIETVVAIFATSAAGGVFVPINPLLRPQQVSYILQDCGVRALVTSAERLTLLSQELKDCTTVESVILVGHHSPDRGETHPSHAKLYPWAAFRDVDTARQHCTATVDLDMAAILYTSGSTGKPKGVVLSHRNLIVGAESVSSYLANNSEDVILAVLPLSFDAGFSQVTTAFSVGAHVVLMNYLLPGDVVKLCAAHSVTGLTCVPPLWIQIANETWPADAAARLRYFANTGGRMPKTTLETLRRTFPNAAPYLMYGLTEAFRSTYLDPAEIDRRPTSIGKAIPNAEILVIRPDGTRCEPGEEGELVHRGALVAMGYWNDATRTAERFRPVPSQEQTWRMPELAVYSGDTVVMDEDGFLYFVGRRDEMIKTSGYRVSPNEVEEAAYSTGLVRDAVALGVDDGALGQRIILVASPAGAQNLDVAALLATMKRQLPRYMVPAAVVSRDAIPRSPNGKYDRVKLRQELAS